MQRHPIPDDSPRCDRINKHHGRGPLAPKPGSEKRLSVDEREEISRGLALDKSFRTISVSGFNATTSNALCPDTAERSNTAMSSVERRASSIERRASSVERAGHSFREYAPNQERLTEILTARSGRLFPATICSRPDRKVSYAITQRSASPIFVACVQGDRATATPNVGRTSRRPHDLRWDDRSNVPFWRGQKRRVGPLSRAGRRNS